MRSIETAIVLLPLLVIVVPVCTYLAVLTVVAPFGLGRHPGRKPPAHRFAIVVPAHDEERVLGRLLASLRELAYPAALFDVVVAADNCSDATAAIARAGGALVFERDDIEHQGKGWALRWLLDELGAAHRSYDAYVLLDADSVVSPNFLAVMNDRLCAGALVVQAYYTVLNLNNTRSELLREASLALVHYLRPAAKMALGASCGLKGNGMAFHRTVIERFGWPAVGLAEDVELHLMLAAAGVLVEFAPEAIVWAEMPATLRGAGGQNERWEAGRLAVLPTRALPLVFAGLRHRNMVAFDAGIEQFVPPLSLPTSVACVCLLAGVVLRLDGVSTAAGVLIAVLGLHTLAGLRLARVSPNVYRAIIHAPTYMVWKVALYVQVVSAGRRERPWVRTVRGATK